MLDEKYVQEGLYFDKYTGVLVGFADLGEKNNILSHYEQHFNHSGRIPCPLAKCIATCFYRQGINF